MIHILVGHEAAKNLEEAFALDENLKGEIVVLKDTLGVGPIHPNEDEKFIEIRTSFWKDLDTSFPEEEQVLDENTIKLLAVKAQREEEPLCFWMSPCVTDVCAYFWLLTYLKQFPGMLHTINIVGLPFLNEKGQLFYPTNFSQIPAKEFLKTKRLLKEVTPAEYEVEGDEWARLQQENAWVRTYEGGKKIVSKDVSFFDTLIKNSLTDEFQKAHKVVNETMKKITQTLSHLFIEWRIKELIKANSIVINGDIAKHFKDFEIKKVGDSAVENNQTTIAV
jgi:hypothetical protein